MAFARSRKRLGSAKTWLEALFSNMSRSRTFGLAGEMAFWLFLSLLPLAAVIGLVVARFAMTDTSLSGPMLATLPPATRELLTKELGNVSAWNGGAVGPLAAAMFVWLASSGVHSIFDGLELETEATPRPWWMKRLLAIATCVVLSIGAASVALLGAGAPLARKLIGSIPLVDAASSTLGVVFRLAFGLLLAIGSVAGLYWVGLPRSARRRMPILPGAVFAVLLQGALGFGYGFYVAKAGDGGAYQAGLAVIGVTMMALYLFCIAILIGAELNQLLGARRLLRATVHPNAAPPPAVTEGMVRCEAPDATPNRKERRAGRVLRPSTA